MASNKSGNVQEERSPSLKCVQTCSKTDKSVSKLAQKGPKRFKRCQNGPMRGVREAQNGGEKGKKVVNGLLAHPFSCENGLLSTLSGKGWTKRLFSGGSSSQCEALGAFSTLLGHFRPFWVLLGPHLLSSESAKSHGNGPLPPNGRSTMSNNSKSDHLVLCGVHFE